MKNFVVCRFEDNLIAQVCKSGVKISSGRINLAGSRGLTPTAMLDTLPPEIAGQFISFRAEERKWEKWSNALVIEAARKNELPSHVYVSWRPEGFTLVGELAKRVATELTVAYLGPCQDAYNLSEKCRGVWVERRMSDVEKGLAEMSINEDGSTEIVDTHHELMDILDPEMAFA